ncbi:spore coat protein SpoU [Neisseria sicca]|uniref:Spore coat protein SpoU n=1 Tax=Neisseria sicca TaxID=490 RepID=A0A2I1X988_NEISI|nr:spore coat protein U domain-containing protein [Neisseria sicca]OFJ77138.1 spore coat protein SpoU [Neisseria sp. HMSC072F04]PLA39195.1 spore coat protein SpoU [Neisseria sicca]
MKTRFTLTSLALASLMMMGNTAMAAVVSSGTSQFFNVKLTVTGSCEAFTVASGKTDAITAKEDATAGADIDFASHLAETNSAELEKDNVGKAANGIHVTCSKNTVFQVALEPGNGNSEGLGSMSGLKNTNRDKIAYQLYKPTVNNKGTETETVGDGISSDKWGKDTNALSLTGKGLSTPIMLPVFAKVPQNELSDKTPDIYQDRVKVTLTY